MQTTLSNDVFSIAVNALGAELCSLKTASGDELLWQADPAVWGRHAPVLFPIVGKLANDQYDFEGQRYSLGQHGFARDMDFELVNGSEDSLSYRLLPTVATRQCYPFEFELWVNFRLRGATLEVEYKVFNRGTGVMPFSIGAHPGFALNWDGNHRLDEYAVVFNRVETARAHFLDGNGLMGEDSEEVLRDSDRLSLGPHRFDRGALIFLGIASTRATLCHTNHPRKISVDFEGFPHLGIWAKSGAPFVCIEPWYGHVDPATHDGHILKKPGIRLLDPGDTFMCRHRVMVGE